MQAESDVENSKLKAKLRREIKFGVQKLYNKRLFYDTTNAEWKQVALKALEYKKAFSNDKNKHHAANKFIINVFYQCVKDKKNGKPFKHDLNTITNVNTSQNLLKYYKSQYDQQNIPKTTYYRIKKRIESTIAQILKPKIITLKIPNYDLVIDKTIDDNAGSTTFQFGYKLETLCGIDADKKYPCYGCHSRIHKLQGKNCMNVNCYNPLIKRRKKSQLQFHDECLIILNWNSIAICGCCAYAMSVYNYKFESGNQFISDYQLLTDPVPIGMTSINNNNIIFFKGYIGDNPREYYFIRHERDLLNKISDPMTQSFITWNNLYRIPTQRDSYEYHNLSITGFKNDKYPNLSLQYIQNKFNGYISGWMAIDNFLPVPEIINELISVTLRDLWNTTDHKRKDKIPTIGAFYDNCKLSIAFINYSYKVIVHKSVENKLNSEPNNKAYKKILNDEFQVFEIDNNWDKPKYKKLRQMVLDHTNELNELIKYLVQKYPKIMYKYQAIQFKPFDMAAFLLYCINQTPHIDTKHVMDLLDPNPSNSALYMINADVNALDIHYNDKTDTFSIINTEYPKPKVVCLENTGRPCNGGSDKQKHLFAGPGTIVMSIPPDVAMSCHQIHDVTGHTLVATFRGLSDETKNNANSIPSLMNTIKQLSLVINKNK